MHSLRLEILRRFENLQKDEQNFKTEFWKNCFVSFKHAVTKDNITMHISVIDFGREVDESDWVRLLEYVIRQQENRMSKGQYHGYGH